MPSPYVLPCVAALLFSVRLLEFRIRGASAKAPVVAPTSFGLMFAAGLVVVVCSFVEYFVRRPEPTPFAIFAGLGLIGFGFALRAIAAKHLNDLWSVHIETRSNHRLVVSGPYRWSRHPIYASLLIELLGGVVLLQATSALIAYGLMYIPVVWWRLSLEEKALVSRFGREYQDYAQRVPAILPLPWKHL